MFTEEGIFPIGDGLLDVDAKRLKGLLVSHDINEIYEVEQTPFARGKFAAVRRAVHKNTGLHFAAKFLKRRRRAQSSDKEIKHEIAVLMLCEGEDNIVNLNAVHETRSDTALLLELATGGELQTILDNEECLSEAQARHCMREVLKALKFLHDRSIAHLDLKPQNILLAGERIEDGLKLCDFGISRVVCEGINVREMAGTPDYVAPEVLQYEPLSLLTDIWSVGVLAYVLLSGFSPFGGDTKQETFLNISQCALTFPDNLFGGVSQAAIDFIRRALRIKPNDRMNAAGCLEHVWLKDECSLHRQIYLQAQNDADFVQDDEDEDDEDDDEEEEDDEEEAQNVSQQQQQQQQQQNSTTAAANTTAAATTASKATHNGHRAHSSSKIPIATSHKLSSPSTETTTAIHTLPQALTMSLATSTTAAASASTKPTQIVTPTRRASDSDKENTYTATFVKKPVASTATIQIGSNGLEETTVIATLALFPDAPTTPKVIRKTPATEASSATSVKALVKKFQLEELEAQHTSPNSTLPHCSSSANSSHASAIQTQLQLQQPRKCSVPSVCVLPATSSSSHSSSSNGSNMRRSISGTASSSNSHSHSSSHGGRRASEPLTAVHKKQHSNNNSPNSISSSSNSSSSSSSNSSSSGSTAATGSSSTALLLNGRLPQAAHHLHHHHMHHHHHHHHHHVVIAAKNAAAAATNNLSLDQGIIC
ncbi:death-associated protein kinase related [Drosophila virilis]|uniref:non-specific serine/threonine protein kinase n=1 Tax=Drosophila virilis TaxID=7244 RepID=B4M360_DROVI|nr:death-associated protein kinase related [Drosophila virilis]EDW65235.2 uncharacterized protein Dvir_GJ19156 [Drosophila virilis]